MTGDASSCGPSTDDAALREALDAILHRTDATLSAVGDAFPYVADPETGEWDTTPDGNWTAGHWIGLLWLAADRSDDPADRNRFAAAARSATETARTAMPRTTPFCGLTFHLAGFRGYDATGDRSLFGLGLAGADAMVELFSEPARQVPIGTADTDFRVRTAGDADEFPDPESESLDRLAAVDTVHLALPACWRAYRETGRARFRDVAVSHADRHLDWFLRPDGSTWNEAAFDPATGALERQFNELAHSDETCWARGLGWHVAGLARAYVETGADRYRLAIERSITYYRDHVPDDLVPYWDVEAPGIPDEPRDTSAAALVAYGLVGLPGDDGAGTDGAGTDDRTAELRAFGRAVLDSLVESYLVTDPADERRGMVRGGTFSVPAGYGVDSELIWTDYYVAAAIERVLSAGASAARADGRR